MRVEKSEKATKNGQVQIYDIMLNNFQKMEFGYFLDAVKPAGMSILKSHADSKKVLFKIKFTMVQVNPLTGIVEKRIQPFWSSEFRPMFHATDIGEFYDMHKNDLLEKFHNMQLEGSGWELESIDGF